MGAYLSQHPKRRRGILLAARGAGAAEGVNDMTIALIEDDEAVLHSLCMLLESRGMTVRAFASADAFLAAPGDDVLGLRRKRCAAARAVGARSSAAPEAGPPHSAPHLDHRARRHPHGRHRD